MKLHRHLINIPLLLALSACGDNHRPEESPPKSTLAGRWEFSEEIIFSCGLPESRTYQSDYLVDISGTDSDLLFTTVENSPATLAYESDVIEQTLPIWPFYFDEASSSWVTFIDYIGQGDLIGDEITWYYSISGLYHDGQSETLLSWSVDSQYDALMVGNEIQGATSFELPSGCSGTVHLLATRL